MERENVNSEMMISLGYEDSTSTLEIEFKRGEVWQYYDVPESVFQEMKVAESKGRFWHLNIKGQYRENRVG